MVGEGRKAREADEKVYKAGFQMRDERHKCLGDDETNALSDSCKGAKPPNQAGNPSKPPSPPSKSKKEKSDELHTAGLSRKKIRNKAEKAMLGKR